MPKADGPISDVLKIKNVRIPAFLGCVIVRWHCFRTILFLIPTFLEILCLVIIYEKV